MNRLRIAVAVAALLISPLLFSPVRRAIAADLPATNFGLNDSWQLYWGTAKAYIYASSANNYLRAGTNGADQLFLNTTGLGIGAAPTNALSVTGSANVTSNLTVSGTSTLTGNTTLSGYISQVSIPDNNVSNFLHIPNISSVTLQASTPLHVGDQWAIVSTAATPLLKGFCVSTATTLGSVAISSTVGTGSVVMCGF